ncbi:MAG: cytochrome C oxidase subunit IV family protein [Rhodothermia bacterium]|nr:cytochrome C oxidase subunit IV family protein [Rhodothermia bacterium]
MAHGHSHEGGGHHITPQSVLKNTFIALLVLTLITVGTSMFLHAVPSLGFLGIPLAILLATGKASLVVLYFMGIKYDKPINGVIAVGMVLFVVIFLVFTLMDTTTRKAFGDRFGTTQMEDAEHWKTLKAREKEILEGAKKVPLTPADYQRLGAAPVADTTAAQ